MTKVIVVVVAHRGNTLSVGLEKVKHLVNLRLIQASQPVVAPPWHR